MSRQDSAEEVIRTACRQDVDALVDLYIACFPERVAEVFGGSRRRTMIRDYLLFYLSWDPANNWAAVRGQEIVGFVIAPCRYAPLQAALKHGQIGRWLWHLLTGRYGLPLHLLKLFLRSGFAFSPNPLLQRLQGEPTIHLCATHPLYQGQGVGSRLMAHTMAAYQHAGVSRCWLLVRQDNPHALALYKKFGFKVSDAVTHGEVVMVWGRVDDVSGTSAMAHRQR